ncbi:signal peptidase II [Desulfobulbus rhabdoformis]|jgi:signal peptidase II|uniref:signal peptidase II n=1 Tax=Desulfobulbus rhabdoformis TaxID=34032 RepID=UPI001963D658|nr:signal peptidase II [Desulfobulbus rhabdoformis]MBM9612757.1 signal peptidase II [Desulfobulbus rhabdoformis]
MLSFFSVILVVICLDQASKFWVMHHFLLHESRVVIPHFFNLTYITNNGAAFSMLAGQPALWRQVFFLCTASVALVLIGIAHRSYGRRSLYYTMALSLIAGGAIGNMIDRIRFGFVIDFLDVYIGSHHWPTFNIADSAITVGVTLFIFYNLLFDREASEQS